MPVLSHHPRKLSQPIESWLAGVSHRLIISHASLFTLVLFGCQRSEQESIPTATDPTQSTTTQLQHIPPGGPSGTPVPATRLRGATLSWIGNRQNSPDALRWNFADSTFVLLTDGPTLPSDLIQLLTGTRAPRRRIDGEWQTTDGRHLKLKFTPATGGRSTLQVTLTIATAGILRVNLGDGRQYNLRKTKPNPR